MSRESVLGRWHGGCTFEVKAGAGGSHLDQQRVVLTSDTEFGPTETGFKVFAELHLYRLGLSEAGSREVVKLSSAPENENCQADELLHREFDFVTVEQRSRVEVWV